MFAIARLLWRVYGGEKNVAQSIWIATENAQVAYITLSRRRGSQISTATQAIVSATPIPMSPAGQRERIQFDRLCLNAID